jgi:hypothetical protein
MIVSGALAGLDSERIGIPSEILEPIRLGRKTRYYSLLQRPSPARKHVEVITTSIHPRYWADSWRIDIETHDKMGNSARITEFLASRSVDTLVSESMTNSSGQRHTMSFIVNCIDYTHQVDASSGERMANQAARLDGLREDIFLDLVDQLTLDDRGYPRLKVGRMSTLYLMFQESQIDTDREIADRDGREAPNNFFELPSGYYGLLQEEMAGPLSYIPSVDTKNRVVRTLIFSANNDGVRTLRISMERPTAHKIAQVFRILASRNGNIIRHHVRFIHLGETGSFGSNKTLEMELSFEWNNAGNIQSPDRRFEQLCKALSRDKLLSSGPFQVEEV